MHFDGRVDTYFSILSPPVRVPMGVGLLVPVLNAVAAGPTRTKALPFRPFVGVTGAAIGGGHQTHPDGYPLTAGRVSPQSCCKR